MQLKFNNIAFISLISMCLIILIFYTKTHFTHVLEKYKDYCRLRSQLQSVKYLMNSNHALELKIFAKQKDLFLYNRSNNLSVNVTEISSFIEYGCRRNGLAIEKLYAKKVITNNPLMHIILELHLRGSWKEWVSFLLYMQQYCLPITINNLQIVRDIDPKLKFTIILQISYIKKNIYFIPVRRLHNKLSILNLQKILSRDLFFKKSFNNYSIYQIQWVGHAVHGSEYIAIGLLPNGETFLATLGQYVGIEHSRIIQINPKEIILTLDSFKLHRKYLL